MLACALHACWPQNEYEMSCYNLDEADVADQRARFELFDKEARRLLAKRLPIPAYDHLLKLSHAFNIMDARGAVGVTERANCFATLRGLAREITGGWVGQACLQAPLSGTQRMAGSRRCLVLHVRGWGRGGGGQAQGLRAPCACARMLTCGKAATWALVPRHARRQCDLYECIPQACGCPAVKSWVTPWAWCHPRQPRSCHAHSWTRLLPRWRARWWWRWAPRSCRLMMWRPPWSS